MHTEPFGLLTLDSGDWKQLRSWFFGIGYDDRAVVLGVDGFNAYRREHGLPGPGALQEGRYIAVLERDEYFSVLTDPMGQDVLYYYSPEALRVDGPPVARWVISNSLLSLMRRARRLDSLSLYRPSLLGFQISSGKAIGAQLFSNNTPVQGVKVLPIGCELRICKTNGFATLHRVRAGDWLTVDDGSDYKELLEAYVQKSLARITALREAGGLEILCDVSGGHDSRAVMAMLQRSGGSAPVTYATDSTKPGDYTVAKKLARYFDTELELRAKIPGRLEGVAAYDIWAYGSAGVYLPIVEPRAVGETRRLRFHGGNFLSKEFGEIPAAIKIRSFAKWIKTGSSDRESVEHEFLQSFDHIDMEADAQFAMQMHYINFRGRFHYGRNWFSHTRSPMITPLISPLLAKAAFRLPPEEYNRNRVSLDLLLALDNALVGIPFDLPEKNFSTEEAETSPFWKDPVSFDPEKVELPRIYGVPGSTSDPATAEPAEGGPVFMEVFRARFPELLECVREARLFNDSYLAKSEAQVGSGRPVQGMRSAAHVAHSALLLEHLG